MKFIISTYSANKLYRKTLWIDQFAKILDALVYFSTIGFYEGNFHMSMVEWRIKHGLKKKNESQTKCFLESRRLK